MIEECLLECVEIDQQIVIQTLSRIYSTKSKSAKLESWVLTSLVIVNKFSYSWKAQVEFLSWKDNQATTPMVIYSW